MEKMLESWEEVNFVFVPYKDTKVSVMAAPDDIQMMLDDHIVKTTTMKNSPFIAPFEKQVNAWDERLVRAGALAVVVVVVVLGRLCGCILLAVSRTVCCQYCYMYIECQRVEAVKSCT